MKKLLTATAILALLGTLFISCASEKKTEEAAPAAEAPVIEIPSEPVELVYGVDYFVDTVFGQDFVTVDGLNVAFGAGAQNSNHAVLFYLTDTTKFYKDFTIQIEYAMGNYDPAKSCQVCVQPSSLDKADYGSQSYPILYNNYEPDNPTVLTVDINKLLKSAVKKELAGFRICCNNGSYDKYTWEDNWDFTITKVTLVPPEE